MKYFVLKYWKNNSTKILCRYQKKIVLFDSYEKALNWLKSWNGYGVTTYHTFVEPIELPKVTSKYIFNPLARQVEN